MILGDISEFLSADISQNHFKSFNQKNKKSSKSSKSV